MSNNYIENTDLMAMVHAGSNHSELTAPLANETVKGYEQNLQQRITSIMQELGFSNRLSGYYHTIMAIEIAYNDPTICQALGKRLYTKIARESVTTSDHVGYSIRYSIRYAQTHGNLDSWKKYFASTISTGKGKVTSSQFIRLISEHLKLEDEKFKQEESSVQSIKLRIEEILQKLNFSTGNKSHFHTMVAIARVYSDPNLGRNLEKGIYRIIAEELGVNGAQVGWNIKRAIEQAWTHGNLSTWEEYFGIKIATSQKRPSNGKFIRGIVDFLTLEDNK